GIYDLLAKLLAGIAIMISGLPAIDFSPTFPAADNSTKDLLLATEIERYIATSGLKGNFDTLAAHYNYHRDTGNTGNILLFSADPADPGSDLAKAIMLLGYGKDADAAFKAIPKAVYSSAANDRAKADIAKKAALGASASVIACYRFAEKTAGEYEKKFNAALLNSSGIYRNIIAKAAGFSNTVPPCGAIAGVYASVDRERGVWKAPANVRLKEVVVPAVKISQNHQAEYNIDVNEGKSINIIRDFPGTGVLVWGARTLAGNDIEWRYVNVRRFFNFVEESTKKSTEQFVFEPNDANTWVRIQAMIENFLTVLWRDGALQGVKPEHAFHVAVGLGKTMTPLDIREGRLIVEIGMAVTRPAEFNILRFSHKMAGS
ncbi:MAG: phage tail sheath family protein, partial [Chlorobiaceae bacterium]|nr:phage tail sheath family protein [Chlorobiaceae bacterium]